MQQSWLSKLNKAQRIGFFATATIVTLSIFLHFPFSGYSNTKYYEEYAYKHLCPKLEDIDKEEELRGKKFSDDEMLEKLKHCNSGSYKTTSFLKWESNKPIIEWFKETSNTLAFIIFSLIIGALFIITFKKNESQ